MDRYRKSRHIIIFSSSIGLSIGQDRRRVFLERGGLQSSFPLSIYQLNSKSKLPATYQFQILPPTLDLKSQEADGHEPQD